MSGEMLMQREAGQAPDKLEEALEGAMAKERAAAERYLAQTARALGVELKSPQHTATEGSQESAAGPASSHSAVQCGRPDRQFELKLEEFPPDSNSASARHVTALQDAKPEVAMAQHAQGTSQIREVAPQQVIIPPGDFILIDGEFDPSFSPEDIAALPPGADIRDPGVLAQGVKWLLLSYRPSLVLADEPPIEGGFFTVYRAVDSETQRQFAVKLAPVGQAACYERVMHELYRFEKYSRLYETGFPSAELLDRGSGLVALLEPWIPDEISPAYCASLSVEERANLVLGIARIVKVLHDDWRWHGDLDLKNFRAKEKHPFLLDISSMPITPEDRSLWMQSILISTSTGGIKSGMRKARFLQEEQLPKNGSRLLPHTDVAHLGRMAYAVFMAVDETPAVRDIKLGPAAAFNDLIGRTQSTQPELRGTIDQFIWDFELIASRAFGKRKKNASFLTIAAGYVAGATKGLKALLHVGNLASNEANAAANGTKASSEDATKRKLQVPAPLPKLLPNRWVYSYENLLTAPADRSPDAILAALQAFVESDTRARKVVEYQRRGGVFCHLKSNLDNIFALVRGELCVGLPVGEWKTATPDALAAIPVDFVEAQKRILDYFYCLPDVHS